MIGNRFTPAVILTKLGLGRIGCLPLYSVVCMVTLPAGPVPLMPNRLFAFCVRPLIPQLDSKIA